jgi:hemerythrin-like metal-binding protein
VDYTRVHFNFEEEMLREAGYESLAEHIEQHRLLTGQVVELLQRIQDGHVISNTTLMLMLRHWLTDHILKDDRRYARALKRID